MKKAKVFAVVWLIVFACALITFAVIVKPTGEIHSSVNLMAGELFAVSLTFAGFDTFGKKDKN